MPVSVKKKHDEKILVYLKIKQYLKLKESFKMKIIWETIFILSHPKHLLKLIITQLCQTE